MKINFKLSAKLLLVFSFLSIFKLSAQVPVAKFGPNKIVYVDQYGSFQFFDSSTNSPTAWEWQVYDSVSHKYMGFYPSLLDGYVSANPDANAQNPEFYFSTNGRYTIEMRCKNSAGWSNWISKKVAVVVGRYAFDLGFNNNWTENEDNIIDSDTGIITDDGWDGNYSNSLGKYSSIVIKPCRAKKIQMTMTQLKFNDNQDVLYVFDSDKEDYSKLLASWTLGNTSNRTVTALSGTMYIVFKTNSSGVDSGFYGTYRVIKDTSTYTVNADFDFDSLYYNYKPFQLNSRSSGFSAVPKYNWTINGAQVKNNLKPKFRSTLNKDGIYQVCIAMASCGQEDSACHPIKLRTAYSKTSVSFKYKSNARYAYDSVHLIADCSNADRFEWEISPTTYVLHNKPAPPSKVLPGKIIYYDTPGDSIPVPMISFLDTVCYTIKLRAYNSLDPSVTRDSLTKTNYICAGDFKKIYGVWGKVYNDLTNNCQYNNSEPTVLGLPVKLYDSNNKFTDKTYTFDNGLYRFDRLIGTYKVVIDLNGTNLKTTCMTGLDSIITISVQNPMNGIDFGIKCKDTNEIDLSVIGHTVIGPKFPGQVHNLKIFAGDAIKQFKGLDCGNIIKSGTVKVKVIGPVQYLGASQNSITPSVSGNTYTYSISDFHKVRIFNDFGLKFKTDTSAQIGDTIIVSVSVLPTMNDPDSNNNRSTFIYKVTNSYDPNMKEVYPQDVPPNFNDWLNYTIHFQNTGNAPAFNIRLEDTLDQQLNFETFELVNKSHDCRVALKGNILKFYFDDIMLADSFTDEEASKGYVQYRIKPNDGLTKGSKIKNTAYIYFDYNTPVVTNTTVNEYVENITSVLPVVWDNFKLFPNPSSGLYTISSDNKEFLFLEVYNLMGEKLISQTVFEGQSTLNLLSYPAGIYTVKVSNGDGDRFVKIIKQ